MNNSVQTTTSRNGGARMGSSDGARPPTTIDFKSPQLEVFNPKNKSADEIKNTTNQKAAAELHVVSKDGDRTAPVIQTILKAKEAESAGAANVMVAAARKSSGLAAAAFAGCAAIAGLILPEKNAFLKSLQSLAGNFTKGAISIGNVGSAVDAGRANKLPLAIAQLGSFLTAIIAPIAKMTDYRGLSIGAYGALSALETAHGKLEYKGLADYCATNWNTLKNLFSEFLKNPLIIFDLNKKAILGAFSGIAMSVLTLLYMMTGIKLFASGRNALGIVSELEKAKLEHLKEGRAQYAGSGYLMMVGSAANLLSEYAGKYGASLRNVNFACNALGTVALGDAWQSNEIAKKGSPVSFGGMIKENIRKLLSFKETEKVLKEAAPVVVSQAQQSAKVQEEIKAVQKSQAQASMNHSREASYTTGLPVGRSSSRTGSRSPVVAAKAETPKDSAVPVSAPSVTVAPPSNSVTDKSPRIVFSGERIVAKPNIRSIPLNQSTIRNEGKPASSARTTQKTVTMPSAKSATQTAGVN